MENILRNLDNIEVFGPGERFDVSGSDCLYYVKEGWVDIFMVDANSEMSNLEFFYRQASGEVFVGSQLRPKAPYKLVAKNCAETYVFRIPLDKLFPAINLDLLSMSKLIDAWVIKLTERITLPKLIGEFINIAEGSEILVEKGTKVSTARRVKWLLFKEIDGFFNSDDGIVANRYTGYFPLTRLTWMQASESGTVEVVATPALLDKHNVVDSLRHYNQVITDLYFIDAENRSLFDSIILFDKLNDSVGNMNAAIDTLSKLALHVKAPEMHKNGTTPLFRAMSAVAKYQNIKIKHVQGNLSLLTIREQMKEIIYQSGVGYRAVTLEDDWPYHEHGALLVFGAHNKPYALIPKSSKQYLIYDPISNEQRDLTDEDILSFNPNAISLYRSYNSKNLSVRNILHFCTFQNLKDILVLFIFSILIGLFALVTPLATQILFDDVIPYAEYNALVQIVITLFVATACTIAFELTRGYALLRLQAKIDYQLENALWLRILKLPLQVFRENSIGELLDRATGLLKITQLLSDSTIISLTINTIFSLISVLVMYYFSPKLTLFAVGYSLVMIGLYGFIAKKKIYHEEKHMARQGKITGILNEVIANISRVRSFGAETRVFYYWAKEYAKMRQNIFKSNFSGIFLKNISEIAPLLSLIIIYAIFFLGEGNTKLSAGEFLGFSVAFTQFSSTLFRFLDELTNVLKIVPLYKRIKLFYRTSPETSEESQILSQLSGGIEVHKLSFKYSEPEDYVLDDVSFKISPGSFVAVVGASGSGKSTLLRLLLGFEKASRGCIYYDQKEILTLDKEALRRKLGVVLQEDELFPGSIYTNLAAYSELTEKQAWELLAKVAMAEEVEEMPMRLQTMVTMSGVFSGGQIQRLLIARALACRPKILLLDEATSALDNITQKTIMKTIYDMKITRFVIAHRLSTIRFADKIIVLKKGKIVETGTYDELLKMGGEFTRLAEHQLL